MSKDIKKDTEGQRSEAQEPQILLAKNKGGRPKGSKDSKSIREKKRTLRILELAKSNLPTTSIAKVLDLSECSVRHTLKKYSNLFKELDNVNDYRSIKTDIIDAAQLAVLKSGLSDKKLEKAGLLSSMQAFEILNKAGRLERGQSTDNHAVNQFVKVHLTGIAPKD